MPFIPATNTVRVFFEHAIHGASGHGWVMHFRNSTAPPSPTDMGELGAALVSWWDTNVRAFMGNYVSFQRMRLLDLTSENSYELTYDTGLPITGTRTGTNLPGNLAFCIKNATGQSGRSFRGRTYFFGMVEGDVTENSVTTTYANGVRAAMNAITPLVLSTDTYDFCVASFYSGGQPRASAVVTPVVNSSYVDLRIDTQRRRLPTGGS